jgi:4-hydroxybenzoate polyprenyltransferase
MRSRLAQPGGRAARGASRRRARAAATSVATPAPGSELAALWRMSRPKNLLPSAALVGLGAWRVAGAAALTSATVVAASTLSAAIALSSMVLNDYFDFDADRVNQPVGNELLAGRITPERTLRFAAGAYLAILCAAGLVPDPRLRALLISSAALTALYTPVAKPLLLVKNFAVAATVAAAPLAGALAAGGTGAALRRAAAAPAAFLFLSTAAREVLMDVIDTAGDARTGVHTVSVVAGRAGGAAAALALMAASAAVAVHAAATGAGLACAARPALEAPARVAAAAAAAAVVLHPASATARAWASGFERARLDAAVDAAMSAVGLGTLLVALAT